MFEFKRLIRPQLQKSDIASNMPSQVFKALILSNRLS